MVIWGTDVVVEDCREKFSRFLKTYKCSEFDSQGNIIYRGYHIRLYHLVIDWHTYECNIWFWVQPH